MFRLRVHLHHGMTLDYLSYIPPHLLCRWRGSVDSPGTRAGWEAAGMPGYTWWRAGWASAPLCPEVLCEITHDAQIQTCEHAPPCKSGCTRCFQIIALHLLEASDLSEKEPTSDKNRGSHSHGATEHSWSYFAQIQRLNTKANACKIMTVSHVRCSVSIFYKLILQ